MVGNILITGNGTLTHAILRQSVIERWDARFTVFSRSESRLAATRARYPGVRAIIGDVRDAAAVHAAIAGHDTVIHGAALKRIPECEAHPEECYQTNVAGSLNVVRACVAHGVKTAIAISTDKACRAVTTYGASKLMMEGAWRAQSSRPTRFIGVRYGNVVASNGSVIPLWRQQARENKPLTITDRRMTRFWMSPTDAVRLVDVATNTLLPGSILIPKMAALTVPALANIICPGAPQQEIGLRSTEKLHEDLVHTNETAVEGMEFYTLTDRQYYAAERSALGHHYDSATCPTLTPESFRAMLKDAEDLEADW